MKQLVFIIAIICSISILFASCSKDEETQTDAEKAEAAEAAAIAAIGLSGTWKGACGSASSDNSTYMGFKVLCLQERPSVQTGACTQILNVQQKSQVV